METAAHYEMMERDARDRDDPVALGHALRHLSSLRLQNGDAGSAVRMASEAEGLYRTLTPDRPLDHANALRQLALALDGLERTEEAVGRWREARRLYVELDVTDGVKECDQHLPPDPPS